MTARDWLTLALRVFGIVLLLRAVEVIAYLTVMLAANAVPGRFGSGSVDWQIALTYALASGIPAAVNTAMALGLLMYGPDIARRFYPGETAAGNAVSVREIYEIGARLLGLYALLLAVPSLAEVVSSFLVAWPSGVVPYPVDAGPVSDSSHVIAVGLYLVMAGWLLLGAKRWAAILTRLQYHTQPGVPLSEGKADDGSTSAEQPGSESYPKTDDCERQ